MSTEFTESVVDQAALAWLEAGGWQVAFGPEIAPDMPGAERADYGEALLPLRLRAALVLFNVKRRVSGMINDRTAQPLAWCGAETLVATV